MFTQAELDYRGEDPIIYFTNGTLKARFAEHRRMRQVVRAQQGEVPIWTKQLDFDVADQVYHGATGEHLTMPNVDAPELNIDALTPRQFNRRYLPPFKLPYTKLDEIQLRLKNTMIAIKGNPFFVQHVFKRGPDFILSLRDKDNKEYQSKYRDIPDLRNPPPLYLPLNGVVGWMYRHPERVYQQGLNRQNTAIRNVNTDGNLTSFDPKKHLTNIVDRTDRTWDNTLMGLVKTGDLGSIRLTDHIAVVSQVVRNERQAVACYKGRTLGVILEDRVKVQDEDDILQDWIVREAQQAGLSLAA